MKAKIITALLAVLAFHGVAAACSIQDRREVQVGDSRGVEGTCSNSGLPITCTLTDSEGISCDGPEGSYSGPDLNAVVFSACGCSVQSEEELQEKKEL